MVDSRRKRLREAFLEIALRAVEQARGASDYALAIQVAQRILQIDRANETAHQHLIFVTRRQEIAQPR